MTLYYSLFSFFGFYLGVFENFYKERQSSLDGSLDRSSGVCYLTKGFWMSLNFLLYGLYVELWVGYAWDSLVPHNVVEPKTGSKKKLVMQLDRDVQVWNIFVYFF
jgi:hypothetical protein